ncbi:Protein of unknown function DUF2800 [uncultured Caudovirales phage]|uniref:DUF2800 domain-containing protein n=1 Tax=uncultured Caudovirales phage TaxID=2100421 RepID=A0A6J5LX38_9CAUD|nr:Protein of unknown function DUF2800 [uncultured Caudovirales phage]CAB4168735.1 Protein of unknown function DUF2800 [uncultured Caudovirales phage]
MAHALLSPSSASRWLACTAAPKLESKYPDKTSDAAEEGTVAHTLGELICRRNLKLITNAKYRSEFAKIETNKYYTKDMHKYCDDYAGLVMERFTDALRRTEDAVIKLEHRLDLSAFVPEGFGTGDCIIIADEWIEVIDLKYGKGVEVTAHENKQMMLYGLAAFEEFSVLYDITKVRMSIHQPRMNNYSSYEIDAIELLKWGWETVRFKAQEAYDGKGTYAPGDHCRFCKAKANCRALADQNMQVLRHDFAEAQTLTPDEISHVLEQMDAIRSWLTAVEEYALGEAIEGKDWPGYKLVEGRSNRTITDTDKAAEILLQNGMTAEQVWTKKLNTITALEKEMGKAAFNNALSAYIAKPPGKPTLVPISDKRPALGTAQSAINDFSNQ